MGTHIVKEGNSFYEIDDNCICGKRAGEEPEEKTSAPKQDAEDKKQLSDF